MAGAGASGGGRVAGGVLVWVTKSLFPVTSLYNYVVVLGRCDLVAHMLVSFCEGFTGTSAAPSS